MRSMTEGLLQSKGTTPQALTRQLPLHRGAESCTNFCRDAGPYRYAHIFFLIRVPHRRALHILSL